MNFAVGGDPTIPELKWEYGDLGQSSEVWRFSCGDFLKERFLMCWKTLPKLNMALNVAFVVC